MFPGIILSGACTKWISFPISYPFSLIAGLTNLSIVPGDTVDSIIRIAPLLQFSNTVSTADITYFGSIFLFSFSYGVGTDTI